MSSKTITREELEVYLKELGKEFRKLNGRTMPAEIILIGGAAIIANYGFRETTTDVDAIIQASSAMKDAINRVGDKYELPYGWLNDHFIKTDSFSNKLIEVSKPYRTFANILDVRIVTDEYLVAMKLRAGRKYKHDLSDVVGIMAEHEKKGTPITMNELKSAVQKLYGEWEALPEDSRRFIEDVFQKGNYVELYDEISAEEQEAKDLLIGFEENYPKVTNQANVNNILATLKQKQKQPLAETIQKCEKNKESAQGSSRVSKTSPELE